MSKYIKLDDAISKIVNTPTRVITGDLTALVDRQHEIIDMLSDLPTIEVSEDCISRADAIKAYNEAVDELVKAEMEEFNLGDFTECSFNTTQLKLIARKIKNAPSVTTEQSSMVGEWELASDDDGEYGICSICGNDADFTHYGEPYRYCPNCGADMRGASNE